MTVTVDHVEQVWDIEGELIYDAEHENMLLPRVAFDDAASVSVDQFEDWWKQQEPALRDQLTSLLADPGPARLQQDITSGLIIMIPVSWALIEEPGYDVVEEALPQFKEAALMNIQAQQGVPHVS